MPKWMILAILFGSQCVFMGVVFVNFLFENLARFILAPTSGPDPAMGIGVLLIVFVPAVILILIMAGLSTAVLKLFIAEDNKKIIVAVCFFAVTMLFQEFAAPLIHDRSLQKFFYKSVRIDVNNIEENKMELLGLIPQNMRDFEFENKNGAKDPTWFLDHLKKDLEVQRLILSVFNPKSPLKMTVGTAHIILPREYFWRHVVRDGSSKTYKASYDFKDTVTIGDVIYDPKVVENFEEEESPYLKIANAQVFGTNRLGLHFQIVNTPHRFVVFIRGERIQASYNKKRYNKSLFSESVIWKDSSKDKTN